MKDLSPYFAEFRECARHLWNTYYYPRQPDWDSRDRFSLVCDELFDLIVARPSGFDDLRLAPFSSLDPVADPRIVVLPGASHTPIWTQRSEQPSPYWDHSYTAVEDVDARFGLLRFFDWDELGLRDFQFLEVTIIQCGDHAELVGRRALIEPSSARILSSCP